MGLALAFLVILILVAANALYVAAEFAAVGVRKTRVASLAGEGNFFAKQLLGVVTAPKRLDRYVATCQIGITISSLVLGAYGQATLAASLTPVLAPYIGGQAAAQGIAAIVVLIGLTVFQMVLGELVPKTVALRFAAQTAMATVLPMNWSQWILSPFIALLNGSGNVVLRLFGQEAGTHRHIHSPEEIALMIVDTVEAGLLGEQDEHRLRRVFRLAHLSVAQIMVPRAKIHAVQVHASEEAVRQALASSPYTRLLVYGEDLDDIRGYLHTKDFLSSAKRLAKPVTPQDVLRPTIFVPRSLKCNELFKRMHEARSPLIVVADEYGGTEGLVTLDDVLSVLLGGMADEFKEEEPPVEWLPDGSIRVAGSAHVLDFEDALGNSWDGTATTASGLVVEHLGRVPQPGEVVEVPGGRITIEDVRGSVVVSMLLWPSTSEED